MVRLSNDQVGRAGEYFVAAEITRRGGYAVTFSGNMPGVDIFASDSNHERRVTIQVKTKTGGDWQTSTDRGRSWAADPADGRFWVLVDLGKTLAAPAFYVIPAYWIENDIRDAHEAYLARHGGHRGRNDASKHHSIQRRRVEEWLDRWDILGILPDTRPPDL